MNILLLSNSAPKYFHFFNALATRFAKDGARVAVAVDSRFSREENGLDALGFEIHEFSTYFASHRVDPSILRKYADCDLNGALLSDWERAQAYDVWGPGADLEFFDRLKSALLSFFEQIFERHRIGVVLYENVSNAFSHFALFVARQHGAEYWGIGGSRLPGRFTVSADPLADDATAMAFEAIRDGSAPVDASVRKWVAAYIAQIETVTPDYMKFNGVDQVGLLRRYLTAGRWAKIRSLLRHAADSRTEAFQIGNPLLTHFNLFLRNVRRRFKVGRVRRLYEEPVAGEQFLFYPLHFHPEASTSILAGAYLDEYEVIRNIAFSLPEGLRLYVKDHVSAWGYPSLDFYRRLKRLPNVRLLAPGAPTKQLIKASRGVITLTSTVGYEALLLKKRVFLYGRVFYEFHRGVTCIENPSALRALIRSVIDAPIDWDDDYNNDFVCAYHLATLPGALNMMQGPREADTMATHVHAELLRSGRVDRRLAA
jgi:hypothetical protein